MRVVELVVVIVVVVAVVVVVVCVVVVVFFVVIFVVVCAWWLSRGCGGRWVHSYRVKSEVDELVFVLSPNLCVLGQREPVWSSIAIIIVFEVAV